MSIPSNSKSIRRTLIRGALVLLWIGLGVVTFIFARGHTLLVDNRNAEDGSYRAPDLIKVSVDGGKGLEFFRGDRDRFTVVGKKHTIRVEFSDGTPPFEGKFELPLENDMYMLSVPKMIRGIEPFVEIFHTAPEPRRDDTEEEDDFAFLREGGSPNSQ
ncbi:DUF6672 family protein [Breznakiella homolactica]|uniref:Uncharacterized protein n=1 Tax=Breznakiella homolactica TaxID=2798577 RepID=A0A7T7XQ51_9SPIR|nr:DUF6672 family protein [Breznakiella homolactica]QQO10404.1 hypothetical protein JFL75_05650 [Breznakiella homolactica]